MEIEPGFMVHGEFRGSWSSWRFQGSCIVGFVSNEWLLRETQMRFVTCIVCECQLQLYGHVARFSNANPAHQILSARESLEWRKTMGQPRASCLQQVDRHLEEMGMGQESVWGMVRWRPMEDRQKVDAATSGTTSKGYHHLM